MEHRMRAQLRLNDLDYFTTSGLDFLVHAVSALLAAGAGHIATSPDLAAKEH